MLSLVSREVLKRSPTKSATQNPPFPHSTAGSEVRSTSSVTGSREDGNTRRKFLGMKRQKSIIERERGAQADRFILKNENCVYS